MKILLADDHWIVRSSLKHVFARLGADFVPLEAGSYEEVFDILEVQQDIGLVVVDLVMPGFDSFEGLQSLRSKFPNVPVIVLSVHDDRGSIMRCIELGVVGYIPKITEAKELSRALENILAGDVYFPREILSRETPVVAARALNLSAEPNANRLAVLTSREKEVISRLGQGLSDAKIAESLELSPNTVRVHIKNIMNKLGLSSRPEAIHFAVTHARQNQKGRPN